MIRIVVALAIVFAVTGCAIKHTNCGDFGDLDGLEESRETDVEKKSGENR